MLQLLRNRHSRIGRRYAFGKNKPLVDYKQRGQYRSALGLAIGDRIHDFEVLQRKKYQDFEIEYAEMRCVRDGTLWHHFDCEEEINSMGFMVHCRDAPQSVKLALEKMLACGSNKFPVRNAIEHMTRRSFSPQNYGFVTEDCLFLGFQTPLLQDHSNLMQVFMDMMFNPLFREEDFNELIWRYNYREGINLEIVGDLASEVESLQNLNETKIHDVINRYLLGREGMSNKKDVLKLTYQHVRQWYGKIFVPRNVTIFTHGDLHPTKTMERYRKILSGYDFSGRGIIEKEKAVNQVERKGREMESENKSRTVRVQHLQPAIPLILSFKLEDVSAEERVLLPILSYILFDMPDAPLMAWNTPKTPYPKHYGYQTTHFNIGITLTPQESTENQPPKPISQLQFLDHEKSIREHLASLISNKIPDSLIEQCLLHLQGEYYTPEGMKIITGCLDKMCGDASAASLAVEEMLNVKRVVAKTLRNYRKENLFENILEKYIVNNDHYVRIWGKNNPHLVDDAQFYQKVELRKLFESMSMEQLQKIKAYQPPTLLQDYRILPKIQTNNLEIFEQRSPTSFTLNSIKVSHVHRCNGIKLTLKVDISDIEEDQIRLLPIICEALPWMGSKGLKYSVYKDYLAMYIRDIDVRYESVKSAQGMKLFLFLKVEFTDRNAEYGFNILSNILHDFNYGNLEALADRVKRKASETYNELSGNLVEIHGRHIASNRSPYAMLEDPLFNSRSTCNLASEILKVANPKSLLQSISQQISQIITRINDRNRVELLFQCRKESIPKYEKYLHLLLNPYKPSSTFLEHINDKGFTAMPCLKYFPNYPEEYIFEAFTVPYYNHVEEVPATLVLSALIDHNIRSYNYMGGCFLFKGAMVAFMRGSRKKFIELEGYYRKIEEVEQAKRFIFQKFRRFTAADQFYSGVSAEEARHFKQAVALVTEQDIQSVVQKHILSTVKQGSSSMLALGPHVANYEPMLKKGWTVERAVQDMSRRMQSQSSVHAQLEMSKYINIY